MSNTAGAVSSSPPRRVVLRRNGRRNELLFSQVNTENLRRMFQVDVSEVWLRNEVTDDAFFPDEDGFFSSLTNVNHFADLSVEGPDSTDSPSSRRHGPHHRSSMTTTSTGAPGFGTPSFRSVVNPPIASSTKKSPTFSLRIIKARMQKAKNKKKIDFEYIGATHFDITEDTANIACILDCVKRKWGEDYIIVASDGIEFEDSPSTRGLQFWKCPSRKLYAVTSKNYRSTKKDSGSMIVLSDSDDDFETQPTQPCSKKRKIAQSDVEKKLDAVMNELLEVKATMTEMMTLQKTTRIPLSLLKIMRDTFQCSICHVVPVKPPIIITKCCKTVLGCSTCVNAWYSGQEALTKSCPKCRAPRGYNETMLLHGLDDFITKANSLLELPEDEDN